MGTRERVILRASSKHLHQSSLHTQPEMESAFAVRLCFLPQKKNECQIQNTHTNNNNNNNKILFYSVSMSQFLLSFLLLTLPLLDLFWFYFLSAVDNTHNKISLGTKNKPGTRVLASWTPCCYRSSFSQWQLSYIFMVTQKKTHLLQDTNTPLGQSMQYPSAGHVFVLEELFSQTEHTHVQMCCLCSCRVFKCMAHVLGFSTFGKKH